MAKTLKEFLHDRALWDHNALHCAVLAMPNVKEYVKDMEDMVAALKQGNIEIRMPYPMATAAWSVSICQAGEAIDKMRLEEPENYKKLSPQIKALRDLRHVATHFGEPNADAVRPKDTKELQDKWDRALAICNSGDLSYPQELYDQSTHMREALTSLHYAHIFKAVCKGHEPDHWIFATQNENVRELLEQYAKDGVIEGSTSRFEQSIPVSILLNAARYHTNMVMDSLDRTSGICRLNHPEIYENLMFSCIKQMRNQMAHFHNRMDGDKRQEVETVLASLNMMNHLRPAFKNAHLVGERGDEANIDALVSQYTKLIMGGAEHDTIKVAKIDDFTNWMIKNFQGKDRIQEAAIYAAGQIVQLPAEQADQILDYVRKHKTALLKPETLLTDLPGQSYVVQIGIKEFVRSMEAILAVDKGQVDIIGIESVRSKPFGINKTTIQLTRDPSAQPVARY